MNILFLVSYSKNLEVPAAPVDGHQVTVVPRSSDWGVSGAQVSPLHARSGAHYAARGTSIRSFCAASESRRC